MTDEQFTIDEQLQAADLRQNVAKVLVARTEAIVSDSIAIFPFSGPQPLDARYCSRLGQVLLRLLATAVRDGRLDPRGGLVADLHRLTGERGLPLERLFTFTYLTERTALDELALDENMGATAEPWPLAAQLVRRASFEVLAAYTERVQQEPSDSAVVDRLTTLHTRPVLELVLAKELQRAERHGHTVGLILFDVDKLSEINKAYGYGVGDRVLERMGILMRKYFRQLDWVARHSEDSIAVLLPETPAADVVALADRARATVDERLAFRDHRTEKRVKVTVSAAVVIAYGVPGDPVDVERLMAEAEAALERAKKAGRNQVVRVEIMPGSLSLADAAHYLGSSPTRVRKLVSDQTLPVVQVGRHVRIPRTALEKYKAGR